MSQRTKSKVWTVEKPTVVFLVPSTNPETYGAVMNQLTVNVQRDLGWEEGSIELIGMVAESARHGIEGLYFLEELGVDTRTLTLLVLWGETSDAIPFEDDVPEACGIGRVALPETGVVLPTIRMPSVFNEWWRTPFNREFAISTYASLIQDGRAQLPEAPCVFVSRRSDWN